MEAVHLFCMHSIDYLFQFVLGEKKEFETDVDKDLVEELYSRKKESDLFKTKKGATIGANDFYEGSIILLLYRQRIKKLLSRQNVVKQIILHKFMRAQLNPHHIQQRGLCTFVRPFVCPSFCRSASVRPSASLSVPLFFLRAINLPWIGGLSNNCTHVHLAKTVCQNLKITDMRCMQQRTYFLFIYFKYRSRSIRWSFLSAQ